MSADDVRLLDEALMQNSTSINLVRSYFAGAVPQNGYTPSQPFTVVVIDNPYTYLDTNVVHEYAHLHVRCGGSDAPRAITTRKDGNGLWYLWEHTFFEKIFPTM